MTLGTEAVSLVMTIATLQGLMTGSIKFTAIVLEKITTIVSRIDGSQTIFHNL